VNISSCSIPVDDIPKGLPEIKKLIFLKGLPLSFPGKIF
jgi:hypothetical protein